MPVVCQSSGPTPGIVANGVAKTYAMTGWRVGWMIVPATSWKLHDLQSHMTSKCNNDRTRAAIEL